MSRRRWAPWASAGAAAAPICSRRRRPISCRGRLLRRRAAARQGREIKAALLLHYAGLDERVNARPAYEEALKKAGVSYTALCLRRRQPRLQRRYPDGALQRGGGEARVAAHARLLKGEAERLSGSA